MYQIMMKLSRVASLAPLVSALALLAPGLVRAQDAPKSDVKPAEAASTTSDTKSATEAPAKPRVAVFRLSGAVTEIAGVEDLFSIGSGGTASLRDLVTRMDKAARDKDVKAVVLLYEGATAGTAQVEELRQAIGRVRAAGKTVYAHADEVPGLGAYTLLSAASRVSVVPTGDLAVTGLYGESPYLRGMLDKLGVQPDFLTCGPFKSASEIYMRHGPSPEADDMQNWLLDSLYETTVERVAASRKVTPETVRGWVDDGPYSAERAKSAGLIDAVEQRQDLNALLRKEIGDDLVLDAKYGEKSTPKPDFSTPFGVLKFYGELLGGSKKVETKKPSVAIVHVDGAIVTGRGEMGLFSGGNQAASTPIRKALDDAAADDTIKAVVLRVDSPGGSAVASEIILDATKRLKAKKPLVVSMGNVAGSGGYYVACAADTVFADASTITASIGVVSGKLATEGLFDKVGVSFKSYKRGQNAGMLASGQTFTGPERKKMQAYMDEVYGVFKGHVTAIRGARLKKPIDELAGGRVFTGKQALELGLVDRLGTLHDAIAFVAEEAKLGDDYEVRTVPKAQSFLEKLLEDNDDQPRKDLNVNLGASTILRLAEPMLGALDPARAGLVRQALGRLELIRREGVILMMPEISIGN
jgi:protease-4